MELVLVDTRSGKRRTLRLGAPGGEPALLGSGIDCDVVVPSADVAEHACTARMTDAGIVLEAVGPTGFLLNEKPAKGAILHPGDVVKLGPFHLVAAGFTPRAELEAPPPTSAGAPEFVDEDPPDDLPYEPEPTPEEVEARVARDAQYAARRRNRRQNEGLFGALILLLVGGAAAVLWQRGVFDRARPSDESPRDRSLDDATTRPRIDPSSTEAAADPGEPEVAADPATEAPADERGWRKPTPPEEVAATLAKVDTLLELQEYARCRWLLWQLAPTTDADRERVDKRRAEVDAAAKIGGEEHLAFVDELVKKGKLPTALGHCDEEAIERFRGLAVWYRLLERADDIEQLLNERVPESLRPKTTRKHARKMPADLEKRSPPPAKVSLAEEFGATDPPPSIAPRPRAKPAVPPESPEPGAEPATPPAPLPPTAEQLTAQAAIGAALGELAAAKPAAVEPAARKVAELVHAAKELAIAPLLARCDELATALEAAPERAPLAELRRRLQSLAAARAAALAFLQDDARFPVLDPRSPSALSRAGEIAKSQKELDRLVDAVRAIWGSEQGGAPAPLVTLSDATARLVDEARRIDGWLAGLGRSPPDRAELLATRLLPAGASKVTVRNFALDIEERRRIDADRETRSRNQLVKETKDADELELLHLANAYREMLGRPQLAFDRRLYAEARNYAALMAAQTKGAKESDPQPEPSPRVGGTKPSGGANYLRARASPRQALQSWCKVAVAHRNLLDPEHRAMAAANVGNFWALQFGLLVPLDPARK